MTKIEINSLDELNISLKRIRNFKEGFVTNYFLNPAISSIWIKHKLLTQISINKTDFYLRNDDDFMHLYFCSASEDALKSDLCEFMAENIDRILTVDILGKDTGSKSTVDLFLENGFYNYTSLVRMTRKQSQSTKSPFILDTGVKKAEDSDLIQINTLLHEYFDRYADQFPSVDELRDWINKQSILACKNEKVIQGFIIFEEIGLTSYLRYWFVHPDFRELKIGSKLINAFFCRTQNATRHLFWVNSTNENAIKRYLHYGFLSEDLIDIILINRQLKYGKQNN